MPTLPVFRLHPADPAAVAPYRRPLTIRLAVLALLLASGLASRGRTLPSALAQSDPAERVTACVTSEMASKGIHGAQLAVMRDGEMIYEQAFGRKHRDRPDPVDRHTQFRIGSTTKTLTAFALMQLVDAGQLDLDAPMTRYLTDFRLAEPGQAEAITVRHLLSHASGLHDTSAFDERDLFGPTDPGAMRRWVDAQKGQQPYAPPGRFWNYSSANYMYAGQILERITGQTFQDYLDQQVFAPAGMADTTMHAEHAVARGDFAYGHYNNPFSGKLEIYRLDEADNWARHPTGYANATAGDLVRFASLMMAGGGELLSRASVAEMASRQRFRDLRIDQYYGLGTFVEFFQGNEMVHHDGGAWGWTATLKWIPEAGVAVATTGNIGGGSLSSATSCALAAYVRQGQGGVSNPCRLDPARWNDFVGFYRGSVNNGTAWSFEVSRPIADGNLQLRLIREGQADSRFELTQDCGLWVGSGPGTFNAGGLGQITFIEDPVEPGQVWIRNRFFVAGMRRGSAPTTTPAPSPRPTEPPTARPSAAPTGLPTPAPLYLPFLRRAG